jgi:hypothetical protein
VRSRSIRSITACPLRLSASPSLAELMVVNCWMSAPAMKFSGFPDMNTTALTVESRSTRSRSAVNSSTTAWPSVFTDSSGTSRVMTAMPLSTPRESAREA